MKSLSRGTLPLFLIAIPQIALAQETPTETPTTIEAIIGAPHIKVLKAEKTPHGRYEKWQEKMLIIWANLSPSSEGKIYTSSESKLPAFNLRIQSDQEEANFAKKWESLKAELSSVTNVTPDLKRWDLSQYTSKSELTVPAQTFRPTPKRGFVSYAWLTRTIEMEGVSAEGDTMYKATMRVEAAPPTTKPLKPGQTLDTETGKIVTSSAQKN